LEVPVKSRIVIGALLTAAACFVASAALAQDKALAEKGAKVYDARKCSVCHSIAGKGNPKGALDDVGSKLTADEIRAWIVTPKDMTAKTKATRVPAMMEYKDLPKADVDALVAYMLTLKK
jgi:mono/diheme cytochrome c family protein